MNDLPISTIRRKQTKFPRATSTHYEKLPTRANKTVPTLSTPSSKGGKIVRQHDKYSLALNPQIKSLQTENSVKTLTPYTCERQAPIELLERVTLLYVIDNTCRLLDSSVVSYFCSPSHSLC